jgi:hypothetical protein
VENRGRNFKNFNLFIYGGPSLIEPSLKFNGRKVDSIELFPASEGFCLSGFLRRKKEWLLLNAGYFMNL